MAEDCLFCKIIAGNIPSQQVYADEDLYAFRDINPGAPTHILLIPRKHISRVADASEADTALLGKILYRASRIAEAEGLGDAGFRLVLNNGEGAGQSVFHLHLHILGGRPLSWPPG